MPPAAVALRLAGQLLASAAHDGYSCTASAGQAVTPHALDPTAVRAAVSLSIDRTKLLPLQGPRALLGASERLTSATEHRHSRTASAMSAAALAALECTCIEAAYGCAIDCSDFPLLQGPCALSGCDALPGSCSVKEHSSRASARWAVSPVALVSTRNRHA